jgi:outer membrane receptor for ferrienterochelin and colicins
VESFVMMRRAFAAVGCSAILAILAASSPATAMAQTGRISGTVTDSANMPLAGAQVTVVGKTLRAGSDESGRFVISGVAPGTYELRAQRLGQRVVTLTGVVVRANEVTTVSIVLGRVPIQLSSIVVSASRRTEKITEAPATVTRLDVQEIQNSVGNSFGGALKQVKGLDYIQLGVMSVAVNARGFNSAFNNRVLQLEDGRLAVMPENGLPLGSFTTIPKVDISSVEVLVGPGSALYGPDASGGVVTLTTKDPRAFQGSTFDVSGGSRSFYDIQGRQAAVVGDHFGYKLSAEYVSAKDWDNHLNYAPISGTTPSPEIGADFNTNVARGEGSLVYYGIRPSGRLELSSGMSKNNTIGLTNVGRNQIKDWKYGHAQLRYTDNNWFGQVYHVESRSGGTYQLNGFAQNRLRYPAITDDSVRSLSAFPDKANFTAGEVQNTFTLSQLNDTRFTWGGQYRHDDVSSKRQWLVDRQTGKDVTIDQKGVYGQLEAPLNNWLKLIAAGRYDKHDFYDAQFSPKAGILVSPTPDQTVRVTYNRAFKSPSILQTSFFYPDFQPAVGVFGNKDGFIIKNAAGTVVNTIDPITPETNNTWELGYKGVINESFYLDATGYYSIFDRFLSPLVIIANFLTPVSAGGPTTAYDAVTGAKITGATGGPQIPLTYFNVGRAKIHGADVGLRYLLTPTIDINGTTSIQKVDNISRKATDPAEATAFNSPTAKATLGMTFAELATRELSASWSARFVTGYDFLSGVNTGHIPGFSTFDIGGSYRLMESRARINLSVQNLFSCSAGTVTANGWIASGRPAIYTQSRDCGFSKKHIEMLNSPEIGTMVFLGLRVDR